MQPLGNRLVRIINTASSFHDTGPERERERDGEGREGERKGERGDEKAQEMAR